MVDRFVVVPVNAVHVFDVELFAYLAPDMFEKVSALRRAIEFLEGVELCRFGLAVGDADFRDSSGREHENIFAIFIELDHRRIWNHRECDAFGASFSHSRFNSLSRSFNDQSSYPFSLLTR